ncbi:cytochrome P450 4V2-like [Clytia hemisphaerica]|uniref:cytochrome P450 4V2-like n=1 Tax=Clytia hemisphaerica TaxID=252671 RepID=UPI0034D78F7A
MIIELVGFLLLVYFAVKLYWQRLSAPWNHFDPIPFKIYPFIGQLPGLSQLNEEDFFREHFKWLGDKDTKIMWLGVDKYLITRDQKVIEKLLVSNTNITKSVSYWILNDWLGSSLLLTTGIHWRNKRKMLTPSFHFNILDNFFPTIENLTTKLCESLEKLAVKGDAFDACKAMKWHSIGVMCQTMMGVEMGDFLEAAFKGVKCADEEKTEIVHFVESIDFILEFVITRSKCLWYWNKHILKLFPIGKQYYQRLDFIKKFGTTMIEKRIEKLKNDSEEDIPSNIDSRNKKVIFLDKMLTNINKGEVTVEDLFYDTQTFIFAGYDTVGIGLSWCLFMLGSHPKHQALAYEEAQRIRNLGIPIDQAVKEMKYIECVIKESLRIHPPVPLPSRNLDEGFNVDGIHYPKGTTIAFDILALHRDSKIWEDAGTFRPERFSSNESSASSTFSFIPFSAGPRNCIGMRFAMMELKVTMYHLLSRFEILAMQKTEELRETIGILHGVANPEGIQIKLKVR